jgi:nucleotide-binding universal stress UspA family protein
MSGPLLLCFDGSAEAENAIRTAGALMTEPEAIVLTVAVPARLQLGFNPVGDVVGRFSGLYREWDEATSELAEEQARRGCEITRDAGLDAQPLVAHGKPAQTILRVADEQDVAAIVLGAGNHSAAAGLLGSVSVRVSHLAKRPVLVIPGR